MLYSHMIAEPEGREDPVTDERLQSMTSAKVGGVAVITMDELHGLLRALTKSHAHLPLTHAVDDRGEGAYYRDELMTLLSKVFHPA